MFFSLFIFIRWFSAQKIYKWYESWFSAQLIPDRRATIEEYTPLCDGFGLYDSPPDMREAAAVLFGGYVGRSFGRASVVREVRGGRFEAGGSAQHRTGGSRREDNGTSDASDAETPRENDDFPCRHVASLPISAQSAAEDRSTVRWHLATMARLGGNTLQVKLSSPGEVFSNIFACGHADPFKLFESGIGDLLFSPFCMDDLGERVADSGREQGADGRPGAGGTRTAGGGAGERVDSAGGGAGERVDSDDLWPGWRIPRSAGKRGGQQG